MNMSDAIGLKRQPASHGSANPIQHLVGGSMSRINSNSCTHRLHHGQPNGILRLNFSYPAENKRVMSNHHVAAPRHCLIDQLRRAVKPKHHPMHILLWRANAQAAIIPLLLNAQGSESLNH